MSRKQSSAFVTTRKGFCYLTVKVGRSNYNIMRIRNYTLEPQDKRDMRRLYRKHRSQQRASHDSSGSHCLFHRLLSFFQAELARNQARQKMVAKLRKCADYWVTRRFKHRPYYFFEFC